MPLKITYLGHSGLLLDSGEHAVAIDPYLTDNPLATMKPAEVKCDAIVLTHGHEDHVGDTVAIAKANKATVYAVFELAMHLAEQGCAVEPTNTGGQVTTDFGFVAFTQAFHSSSYQGRYMGMPCGVVIQIAGVTLYHCGDTALFSDMKLIGDLYHPDIAAIPIGDRFTMGPATAARAAQLIQPKVAIPVHYKTFPMLVQSADGFKPRGVPVKVLEVGEVWEYEGLG